MIHFHQRVKSRPRAVFDNNKKVMYAPIPEPWSLPDYWITRELHVVGRERLGEALVGGGNS